MYGGDRARKENLVEYGFRLPAAKDNRPLRFEEFDALAQNKIYVSATPGNMELIRTEGEVVEQLIRPTGIIDPPLRFHVTENQIDDLLEEVRIAVNNGEKVIVTTITKRMAEELSKYFTNIDVRNNYIHSDIDTLERIEILDSLRNDLIDVLVGVNLLREGIDLPEVGVVAILDADKEGFLRNERALTQIAGRAARNRNGRVLLYGDTMTDSLRKTIEASNHRRSKQIAYNIANGIVPRSINKGTKASALLSEKEANKPADMTVYPIYEEHYSAPQAMEERSKYTTSGEDIERLIAEAKREMESAAKNLQFKQAARWRDEMYRLQKLQEEQQ
jgi:excinuclease ABC subunit B